MNSMKYQAGATVGLFLFILASAFTGPAVVGYSAQCINQFDDDGDSFIDIDDPECSIYPFEDGNGETLTDHLDRYNSDERYSLFDYHVKYLEPQFLTQSICFAYNNNWYITSNDIADAEAYLTANFPEC